MDQELLIESAAARDPAAEKALYEAHVERIFRLAYRMTGDSALAEDLTQDTFLRAFDRLDTFRRESAFGTWLHSIAVSVILNGMRKVRMLRTRETSLDNSAVAWLPGPRQPDTELKLTLQRTIDALDPDQKMVLVMHDMEGYKHHEIAEIMGIRTGTSKARLSRARAGLRRVLGECRTDQEAEA